MPLSDANIVQSNSGGFSGTTGNATLGAGTTAGNTLLLFVGLGPATIAGPPVGFNNPPGDGPSPASQKANAFHRSNVPGGETSWAITLSATAPCVWVILEVENLDLTTPVDVKGATWASNAAASSIAATTTPTSTTYDGLAVVYHLAASANTTVPTWSGHTGGFTELADQGQAGATTAVGLSVALQYTQSLSTFACTATASATLGVGAGIIVFTAAGAKRAADVAIMAGFEWGTTAGLTTGGAGCPPFDAQAGSPAIVSTTPRSGTYCLELSAAAAVENLQWTTSGSMGNYPPTNATVSTIRACVRFPSSLPAADVEVLSGGVNAGTITKVRFRVASGKLGVQIGAGTEQLSVATVAADTWYGIDLAIDQRATTYTADWQLDGVAQTQATLSGQSAGAVVSVLTLGWTAAATATVHYDDVVVSKILGHYPLGDFQVLPLKPDPAGTLTITGTSGNFQTFTANGTLAAWNAATALTNISDLPPTIGASADGLVQINLAATDCVNIPMETDQAAPDGAIRGARMYACGWATSVTAATIGFRSYDGTTETTLFAAADPAFDNSTTTPAWVCRMVGRAVGAVGPVWSQAKLDALDLRVGFSGDATPDIGIHSIMSEAAIQVSQVAPVFGDASTGDVLVTAATDPGTGAIIGLDVATPTERGGTLTYEVSGTPTSVYIPPGDTDTQVIDAAIDATTVNTVKFEADPEPEQY